MSIETKQYTTQNARSGYWVNAKGIITPASIVKEIDKERDNLVGELVERAISIHSLLGEFKLQSFSDIQAFVDCYATAAERQAEYSKSAELWAKALLFARSAGSLFWATRRLEFCSHTVHCGWGGI